MQKYSYRIILTVLTFFLMTVTLFAQDNTVLLWTTFDGTKLDWLNAKATEFNEMQSGYVIEVQSFADDAQLLITYNNNEGIQPALLHLNDDMSQEILDLQITQPIGDFVADAETILEIPVHQSEWFDTITAHASFNDTWTTIPVSVTTAMMSVNSDLLTELESSFTFVPQDLMTLELVCEELQSAIEAGTIDACIAWDDTAWLYENWLAQHNIALTDNNNGRDFRATTFDLLNDASLATTEFMRLFVENGYAQSPVEVEVDSIQQFVDGRVAILLADNTALMDTELAFSADLLPSNVDFGWAGARLDTENLWLSAVVEPEIAETAVSFGLFLTSPENNVEWYEATGSLPLSQTAYDLLLESDFAESHPEQMTVFRALTDSVADGATLFAVFGDAENIREALNFGLNQIIGSDVDIAQGLETTQAFVIAELETYNLSNSPDID